MIRRDGLNIAEALLHRLDQHLAHRLTRQSFSLSGPPSHDLTVAAVLGESGRDGLAGIALDLETVRAPAPVTARRGHFALMWVA